MTKPRVQFVILCEDSQQEVFARCFLYSRGVNRYQIRVERSPDGKGAGEQFVRENYPQEVRLYRSRSTHLSNCLAVLIDADMTTMNQRLSELDNMLDNDSQSRRQKDEKIAIFVPKRNIETWIHYLKGSAVDEETTYPKLNREGECKPEVKKLARREYPPGWPENAPPSLRAACGELQRILP